MSRTSALFASCVLSAYENDLIDLLRGKVRIRRDDEGPRERCRIVHHLLNRSRVSFICRGLGRWNRRDERQVDLGFQSVESSIWPSPPILEALKGHLILLISMPFSFLTLPRSNHDALIDGCRRPGA